MKRILVFALSALAVLAALAQPKDAWKATATLTAYDAQGTAVYSGPTFFVSADGTIVAPYSAFQKAVRAEVADVKGKRYAVSRILGASENYDMVRATTEARPSDFLAPIADSTAVATAGTHLYAVGYSRVKKEKPVDATVTKATPYDGARFYEISLADAKFAGCPLIDAAGRVVAIVSQHTGEALDIRFATALAITANSAFDRELRSLPMAKAIPADKDEAQKYITLLDALSPTDALVAMDDFVAAHPDNPTGYTTRAARRAAQHDYRGAAADYEAALRHANNETPADAVHYAFSRSLYNAATNDAEAATAAGWTYERALQEADAAQTAKPAPVYVMQQGSCLYALERYGEAYNKYTAVNRTELASDETFFTAALALERAGGDSTQILALMDSVIARQERPYTQRAAGYFLERAGRLVRYGQHRRAVQDYNEVEHIIGPRNLTDTFYYLREQSELQAHMYQQALDDIQSATLSAPAERKPYYQTEEAFIYLTCGEYESAKAPAEAALAALPDNVDALRVLGVACGETGDKVRALECLKKAKALGDINVDTLIAKYQ